MLLRRCAAISVVIFGLSTLSEAKQATAVLEPLIGSSTNTTTIDALFNFVIRAPSNSTFARRQSECPSGYSECSNRPGFCCPSGGKCCKPRGCCNSGEFCYSDGCCPSGDFGCAGNSCCPKGAKCCPQGKCCRSGTYCVTVDGVRGCCENGHICDGSVPPPPDPEPDTTSIPDPFPTTSFPAPTAASRTIQQVATYTPAPVPANLGGNSETISAGDARISYTGGSWSDVSTPCGSSGKRCPDLGATITLPFFGTSIYMNLVKSNSGGIYSVTVDAQTVIADAFSNDSNGQCALGFSNFGLTLGNHTIIVKSISPSTFAPASSTPIFQLQNFVVTSTSATDDNSSPGGITGATGATSSATSLLLAWSEPGLASGLLLILFSLIL